MSFQKGRRIFRQGGRENGLKGGRPTKVQQEVKRLAAELAKKYLEDRLKPVLDVYFALATGEQTGKTRRKLDPATCRHYVERFVAPAAKTLTLEMHNNAEWFYDKIQREEEEGR